MSTRCAPDRLVTTSGCQGRGGSSVGLRGAQIVLPERSSDEAVDVVLEYFLTAGARTWIETFGKRAPGDCLEITVEHRLRALRLPPGVALLQSRFEPTVPLERTEYVRSDESYSILARIVQAAQIDTIVHTFLVVDSTQMRSRTMHEINTIGTMNLFAAASTAGSTVRVASCPARVR